MNCIRFANTINNTKIVNTFNNDNSNIANIETQRQQIITTITEKFLKFRLMIKIPIVANYTFLTVITFSQSNSFT